MIKILFALLDCCCPSLIFRSLSLLIPFPVPMLLLSLSSHHQNYLILFFLLLLLMMMLLPLVQHRMTTQHSNIASFFFYDYHWWANWFCSLLHDSLCGLWKFFASALDARITIFSRVWKKSDLILTHFCPDRLCSIKIDILTISSPKSLIIIPSILVLTHSALSKVFKFRIIFIIPCKTWILLIFAFKFKFQPLWKEPLNQPPFSTPLKNCYPLNPKNPIQTKVMILQMLEKIRRSFDWNKFFYSFEWIECGMWNVCIVIVSGWGGGGSRNKKENRVIKNWFPIEKVCC